MRRNPGGPGKILSRVPIILTGRRDRKTQSKIQDGGELTFGEFFTILPPFGFTFSNGRAEAFYAFASPS